MFSEKIKNILNIVSLFFIATAHMSLWVCISVSILTWLDSFIVIPSFIMAFCLTLSAFIHLILFGKTFEILNKYTKIHFNLDCGIIIKSKE